MTKPKAGGGLGLRDIQIFNQALLAKQVWRILILLGKYCHKTSFLEAQAPAVCSHGWRSKLHGRDLLKGNVGKAIGNGEDTRVWKDSWLSLEENIKILGQSKKKDSILECFIY
ncbi:BnaC05g30710D [Brassica napus]|uniref:BnaC05g30710D protein n=1 Tax=Brassica napus TaxID=3708 RepID=A0A078I2P6_BRANA|nr:BnaC05g30710D [Brassica napus]